MFKRKYRIVTDQCHGYKVQYKYILFPFWIQLNVDNSSFSVVGAIEKINSDKEYRSFKSKTILTNSSD
tara:strand:+ start:1951 stop:2154 length:204 start_codon:yes stop_codon:yes gene_type:complete